MTIVGLDDTDSRERGMCSTYLGVRLAEAIAEAGGRIDSLRLIRLNPAVKHKTRGNAAVAIHTDLGAADAFDLAIEAIETYAIGTDPRTSPGVVVAPHDPEDGIGAIPDPVSRFAEQALREIHSLERAIDLVDRFGYRHRGWAAPENGTRGRGRIGALAATGSAAAFEAWTYEHISYREFDRCGTPREVDADSVFEAADWGYPIAWDTVDRGEGEVVCVPNAPGPILHGIRGDDPDVCRAVADRIESEPIERSATFVTNQGTDAHLASGTIGSLRDGAGYRVDGIVASPPETRRGGHVFFDLERADAVVRSASGDDASVQCVAFEPTKRFRDRIRSLRVGDRLTVCGELDRGTIKLEKVAVRELIRIERTTPTCPSCDRRMSSAGRSAGYRCRNCGTTAPGKVDRPIERDLEPGWYEVPPCARRHVAKPLIRGGFDAPIHPER